MEYKCDKCNHIFSSKYNLEKHFSRKYPCYKKDIIDDNINDNDNIYKCNFCDTILKNKKTLSKHIHKFCKNSTLFKNNIAPSTIIYNTLDSNQSSISNINGNENITNTTNTIYNIYINGITFTPDEFKYLDTSKPENVEYLLSKIKDLQRPFCKENTSHISEDEFIQIFENIPLKAFEKFINNIYKSSQNHNITIINKHTPYITYIRENLYLSNPQYNKSEREKELIKVTNYMLNNFFKIYKEYKIHLSDITIEQYTEFRDVLHGVILTKNIYLKKYRINELENDFDEHDIDNFYILDEEKPIHEFESLEEYNNYYKKYTLFEYKRNQYEQHYIDYCNRIKLYNTLPKLCVQDFIINTSKLNTSCIKKHNDIVNNIQINNEKIK